MAKANRQKYNFLAALLRQVEDAAAEGDELYGEFTDMMTRLMPADEGILDLVKRVQTMERTYDDLNRWVAQLELALEELDDDWSESSGEEPESDDDGDDDSELARVEPPVGGTRAADGRLAAPVGRARDGQGPRRAVTEPRLVKERIGRGTPT